MRFEIESIPAITSPADFPAAVVETPSTDARQFLYSGIRAAQCGNRAEARIDLLRSTELDPEIESAWLWLASISEYPEELLDYLEHVLSINPHNQRAIEWKAATNSLLSKTFVQRGADAVESNDKELASDHFVKALEYDQRNAVAWMWLANLTESHEGKLPYIEKALSIDPEFEEAVSAFETARQQIASNKLNLAKSAAVAGRLDEANDLLAAIVSVDPGCVNAWKLKAVFAIKIEDKIAAYSRLVDLDPDDIASAAALESLCDLAFEIPVARTEEPRQVSPESDGLTMAIAEIVRYETDEAPHKTPTEELHMPEGVEEAFGALHPASTESEEAYRSDTIQILAKDVKVNGPAMDVVEAAEFLPYEAAEPENESVTAVDAEIYPTDAIAATQYDNDTYLEAAYEFANVGSELETPAMTEEGEVEEPAAEYAEYSFDAISAVDTPEESAFVENQNDPDIAEETPQFAAEPTAADPETIEYQQEFAAEYDPSREVSSSSDLWADSESDDTYDAGIPMPAFDLAAEEPAVNPYATVVVIDEAQIAPNMSACPYCGTANDAVAVSCQTCLAVLTLSDLELLLSNHNVDRERMTAAVESLEMERTLREFGEKELTTLGIGHLNLRNFVAGFAYLEEASRMNATNVVLTGQVNILHIRLEEIKAMEEAHATMTKGKTILVVDDSPTILKLIAGKLEKAGHDVYCSENGEEAMEWIKGMVPDLVLLDINMPKMDGYQVCKLIRSNEATKDVPIVMISGKDGFFDKVRGRMAGTSGHITKPFGPETLMKTVESYLQGQPVPAE